MKHLLVLTVGSLSSVIVCGIRFISFFLAQRASVPDANPASVN